ncbi:diguanylate cyclase [Vogesella fluminis]
MQGMPQAYDLILVDRDCKLVLSFKVSPGFDASERSYCKAMRDNSRDDRFVSERFRTITGDDVVLATQRVRGDDGKVIGLIGSAVRVEHFQAQINRAMIGNRHDVLVFADKQRQLLARQPMLPKLPAQPVPDAAAEAMIRNRQSEAQYEMTSTFDGRRRLHVTHQVEHLPLIVSVGIDKDTLLAPWWSKLALFLASWLVMVLLIVYAIRRYLHSVALSEALSIRGAAVDHAAEAIAIADGNGVVQYINPAFSSMTGYRLDEVRGQRQLVQLLLEQQPELQEQLLQTIHDGKHWRSELSSTRRDGHSCVETVSVTPVHDQYKQLRHIVAIKYDISAAKKLQADLERLANTDELTGLYNRRQFLQRAQEEIARGQRWQRPLSLAMLDLDFFKRLNDRFGHGFGDEVLRRFASCIQFNVRLEDVCGRLGGEEFAILLPDTDRYNAGLIMQRVREAVEQIRLDNPLGGEAVRFTVSIGISELYPGEETPTPLIARADAALYLAKQEGRNCVRTS